MLPKLVATFAASMEQFRTFFPRFGDVFSRVRWPGTAVRKLRLVFAEAGVILVGKPFLPKSSSPINLPPYSPRISTTRHFPLLYLRTEVINFYFIFERSAIILVD
jgi:hypothetical protein